MRWSSTCLAALAMVQVVTVDAASRVGTLGMPSTGHAAGVVPGWSSGPEGAESPDERVSSSPARATGDSAVFLSGVYLTLFGGASMMGGLLYTTAGPGEYCPNCASSQFTAVGYAALIGGFVAATTGGVFIVLGSRDDPDDSAGAASGPSVSVGPGRATLRFSFSF